MKLDYLEKLWCPLTLVRRDSLSGFAALVNEVSTKSRVYGVGKDKLSYWQLIFLQSKANGCSYRDEALPHAKWQWPRDTWFQEQLSHRLRAVECVAHQT